MYLFDLGEVVTIFREQKFNYHFNCNGYYNGKQSWLSDDGTIKIIWDSSLTPKCWRLSGDTLGSSQVINTNPVSPPINGNWSVIGAAYSVKANQGECPQADALVMNITKNNPSCTCDGAITVAASGGVPPYQYSYNNGTTYINSPIKNNLCGNLNLTVMVKDSMGTVVSQLVQIPPQEESISYLIEFKLDSTTVVSQNPATTEQVYNVVITPPLANGHSIVFDLNVGSKFSRTPYSNSASSTYTTEVKMNGNVISLSSNDTTESTGPNTGSGCQAYLVYNTNYNYTYNNITITNSDTLTLKTIQSFELTCRNTPPNQANPLMSESNDGGSIGPLGFAVYGYGRAGDYVNCCRANFESYILNTNNATVDGCNCCKVSGTYSKSLYE